MSYYSFFDLLVSVEKLNSIFFFQIPEKYRFTAFDIWKKYGFAKDFVSRLLKHSS